jgi:hypothetical protein
MSSPTGVAVHEAAHALAAHVLHVPIRSVSIRPKESHLGVSRFAATGEEPPIDCAIVFAAGRMAERMYSGRAERTNWFDVDDPDVTSAVWFLDRTADPLAARQLVELRTRSLLSTRWPALTALADELDRRVMLLGPQVEKLLRGVRRAGDKPHRPIDPSKGHAVLDGQPIHDERGRPLSVKKWSTVLDRVGGFDVRRALKLVAKQEGEGSPVHIPGGSA